MIELDEAQGRLAKAEPIFVEALNSAASNWHRFVGEMPEVAMPLDKLVRVNFIHSHVRVEVSRLIEGVENIAPADGLDFFAVAVKPGVLVRFKCVESGAPSNYRTKQQKKLARQQFDEDMLTALGGAEVFGERPTLLTCGYTMDGTSIGRIEIRYDHTGRESWRYDVFGGGAVTQPLALPGVGDAVAPAAVKSKSGKASSGEKKSV